MNTQASDGPELQRMQMARLLNAMLTLERESRAEASTAKLLAESTTWALADELRALRSELQQLREDRARSAQRELDAQAENFRLRDEVTALQAQRAQERSGTFIRWPVGGVTLRMLEREAIHHALETNNWNQAKAAELLGVTPRVLSYIIGMRYKDLQVHRSRRNYAGFSPHHTRTKGARECTSPSLPESSVYSVSSASLA